MKTTTKISLILGIILGIIGIICNIIGNYQYDKNYQSYWNLADKSSTIDQKSEYVDKYVNALETGNMSGYNALIFTTPDNSFDANLTAVKSLQGRLHEIKKMDINSFEYQTAIQQITAQEQGEATVMIKTFEGIWWKSHYPFLWNWLGKVFVTLVILLIVIGITTVKYTCTYKTKTTFSSKKFEERINSKK